jgi:enamine deaminase RidA (YjgF/YER057c/UK114 family)
VLNVVTQADGDPDARGSLEFARHATPGREQGKHARSAVGVGSLPFGVPVQVEMVLEVQ